MTVHGGRLITWTMAVAAVCLAASAARAQMPQFDSDDIGGVVTSANGPEAGVWVIADTD